MKRHNLSYTDIALVLLPYLLLYTIHPTKVPPLSKSHTTKPIWLSLLYKKSGRLSTRKLI